MKVTFSHVDIDECSLGMLDCSINARCTNTAGSYQCNCIPGFIGNGRFCSKIGIILISELGR